MKVCEVSAIERAGNLKKELSQYYTGTSLGSRLVSLLPRNANFVNALDLGVGEGALLLEVSKRYPKTKLYGYDIDAKNIEKLGLIKSITSFQGDSTTSMVYHSAKNICGGFDLIIGNPPFKSIENTDYIAELLSDIGVNKSHKKVRAEVVFIFQALNLLKDKGILAFILPDGIFTNVTLANLRRNLATKYCISEVLEVPNGSFVGTEAKTHFLVIKKMLPKNNIKLSVFDVCRKNIFIDIEQFIERADYSFYSKPTFIGRHSLKELNVEIIRGSSRFKVNEELHTTSFTKDINFFSSNEKAMHNDEKVAIAGDIIIPRVGTRCIGRVGVIISGCFSITDCLIIIRCKTERIRTQVLNTIKSEFGVEWLRSSAKGVGAKHLTLHELGKLPIMLNLK